MSRRAKLRHIDCPSEMTFSLKIPEIVLLLRELILSPMRQGGAEMESRNIPLVLIRILSAALSLAVASCAPYQSPSTNRAFAPATPVNRAAFLAVATTPADPDLCPSSSNPDPGEQSIGGLSSRSVLHYSTQPDLRNLYSRLMVNTKVCTSDTLSAYDRDTLTQILNFVGITNARSFAATIDVTGDAYGGIKYPQVAPFGYTFDQSKNTYVVQTIGQFEVPWQVT
jgi:hypothetical protein